MENCKAPEIRQDFTKLHIYVGIKREREKLDSQYLDESTIFFCLKYLILFVRGDSGGQRAVSTRAWPGFISIL